MGISFIIPPVSREAAKQDKCCRAVLHVVLRMLPARLSNKTRASAMVEGRVREPLLPFPPQKSEKKRWVLDCRPPARPVLEIPKGRSSAAGFSDRKSQESKCFVRIGETQTRGTVASLCGPEYVRSFLVIVQKTKPNNCGGARAQYGDGDGRMGVCVCPKSVPFRFR